jgi:hypothetical protein
MRAMGAEILSVPKALCYHGDGTAGLSIRQVGSYSSMRVLCLIRNRWQLILKNYSLRALIVLSPLFLRLRDRAARDRAAQGLVARMGACRGLDRR